MKQQNARQKAKHKVILSMNIANDLIRKGFPIIEVKPSNRYRGKAAFIFENTPEFTKALAEISESKGLKL